MPQTGNRINILYGTQQTYDTLQTHDENSIIFAKILNVFMLVI